MLLKVVGIENSKGKFKPDDSDVERDYDNMILHCLEVEKLPAIFQKNILICGNRVCEVKVKNDFQNLVYVGEFPVKSWNDLNGCIVDMKTDADKKVLGFIVTSIDGAQ